MNQPAILLFGATIVSIMEMILYVSLKYPNPIPVIGFIMVAMAIFSYAHDKSRPKED